jgi:hypothetical protein
LKKAKHNLLLEWLDLQLQFRMITLKTSFINKLPEKVQPQFCANARQIYERLYYSGIINEKKTPLYKNSLLVAND